MRFARAAVIDQRKALAFGILEVDGGASVARAYATVRDAGGGEAFLPPRKARLAGDAQPRAGNGIGAAPLRRRRPVEEGDVGAGRADAVGVEEVVGRYIVLVHRLLHQPEAE